MRNRSSRETLGRLFALVFAVGFIGADISGLAPTLHTDVPADAPALRIDTLYVETFELFPVNILHTLIHWTFGLLAVATLFDLLSIGAYARGMAMVSLQCSRYDGTRDRVSEPPSGCCRCTATTSGSTQLKQFIAGFVGFYLLRPR